MLLSHSVPGFKPLTHINRKVLVCGSRSCHLTVWSLNICTLLAVLSLIIYCICLAKLLVDVLSTDSLITTELYYVGARTCNLPPFVVCALGTPPFLVRALDAPGAVLLGDLEQVQSVDLLLEHGRGLEYQLSVHETENSYVYAKAPDIPFVARAHCAHLLVAQPPKYQHLLGLHCHLIVYGLITRQKTTEN